MSESLPPGRVISEVCWPIGSKLIRPLPLTQGTRKAAPPPEAAYTRDHTPQNGACETGVLSISQAIAKANRFKRDRSTHSRFSVPYFLCGLCQGGVRTRRSGLFPFLRGWSPMSVPEISRRTRSTSTPRRCLRVGLTQRDAPRRQSTLFAFASSPRKLNQRRGDLLLTRLLDHLDEHFSRL